MREKIKKEKKGKLGMLLIMSAIASFYAIFFAKDLFYYRSALSIVLGLSAAGAVVFLSGLYRNTGRVEDFKASMKQMSLTLLFLSVMIVGASLICGLISFIIYSCMNGGSNLSDIKTVIALVIGIFLFLITPFFISVFFSVAKGTGSFKEEFKKGIIPGVLRYAKLAIIQASAFFAGFGIEKGMCGDKENGNTYSGKLIFTFYDNFGLDEDDLTDTSKSRISNIMAQYGILSGFRSWYILQHYDEYKGNTKPFKIKVEVEKAFSGKVKKNH